MAADERKQAFALQIKDLIARAIDTENAHHLHAIDALIDTTEQSLEAQISARADTLDAYFDGLRDMDERSCRDRKRFWRRSTTFWACN